VLVEFLSDHPGDELSRVNGEIEAQQRRIEAHRVACEDLRARQASSRRWWQFRLRAAHRDELRRFVLAAPVIDGRLEKRRAQQVAGISGEEQMTAALHQLSDEWRLFRGYANRRGEVDHLLVGPRGVWAIEVKRRAVRVHISGDHWSFEKFDRYGNLRDSGTLADRGGRSWGRQVSEIAGELERFLASRAQPVTVRTAVVLLHERGELGSSRDVGVDLFSVGPGFLLERVQAQETWHEESVRDAIARLVRRDHAFHAERRKARG
jgi:hypothetical protein